VIVSHPLLAGEKLLLEVPEHLCAQRGELGLFVLERTDDRGAKLGHALTLLVNSKTSEKVVSSTIFGDQKDQVYTSG